MIIVCLQSDGLERFVFVCACVRMWGLHEAVATAADRGRSSGGRGGQPAGSACPCLPSGGFSGKFSGWKAERDDVGGDGCLLGYGCYCSVAFIYLFV